MRTTTCEKSHANYGISRRFCQKLHTAVSELKEKLIARYAERSDSSPWRIREAISAAESQAWETPFPHLLFPDLAEVQMATFTAQRETVLSRSA